MAKKRKNKKNVKKSNTLQTEQNISTKALKYKNINDKLSSENVFKSESVDGNEVIVVKNAEGDPDTKARILIKNKIDYTPKVSVIIPVYNTEKYLKECLDSVINQSLKEIEIICVDDGSTDNSLEILKEYAAKDNRITVLTQENLYAGVARNAGMMVASGEYYHFLDSDDFVEDVIYSNLLTSDDDMLVFKYNNFDTNTNTVTSITGIFNHTINNIEKINPKAYADKLFQLSNPMPWNKIVKSNIAKQVKFQNIKASNDIFFSFMSMAISSSILFIDSALVYYRYNRVESLKNTRDKSPKDFLQAYKYLKLRLENFFIYDNFAKSYYQSLISSSIWTIDNVKKKKDEVKLFIKNNILHEIDFSLVSDNLKNIFLFKLNNKIIVSLTSFPARINLVHISISSILNQSVKPDKVILWLATEQFPGKENDLPKELLNLTTQGLEIDWYHDIKSYKKLIPTLKKYPNDIIITIDDDLIYDSNLIKNLIQSYDGKNIISSRLTRLTIDNSKLIVADRNVYENSKTESILALLKTPSFLNSLNSGSGCLYPPKCFDGTDILNEKLFMELAPTCDDLWFWIQACNNNIKVKYPIHPNPFLKYIENSQEISLWKINNDNDRRVFYDILNKLVKYYGVDLFQFQQESLEFAKCMLNSYRIDIMDFVDSYRVDIKNNGLKNNKAEIIQVSNVAQRISTEKSNGYSFIGNDNIIEFKAIKSGKLVIDLFNENKSTVYNQIKLNGKNLLEKPLNVTKNNPFKIQKYVIHNQKFKLEIDYSLDFQNKLLKHYSDKNLVQTIIKNFDELEDMVALLKTIQIHIKQTKFRLDLQNTEDINDSFELKDIKDTKNTFELLGFADDIDIQKPSWFNLNTGQGVVIHGEYGSKSIRLKAVGSGYAYIKFMSPDVRLNGKRLPIFTNFTNVSLNKKSIFSSVLASHDKFVRYDFNIKDGDEIVIDFYCHGHEYTDIELENILSIYAPNKQKDLLILLKSNIDLDNLLKVSSQIKKDLNGFKINIRNVRTIKNNIELVNNTSKINISTPAWFSNDKGIGSVLTSQNYKDNFKVKAIGNGNLSFKFMGIDKRFNNERIPLYVNYQSIKINGKEILKEPIVAWHDKAFTYEMKVKDGEVIDVEVIRSPYPYTENELKDLIIKLSNGVEPKDINNIIKNIIKNRLKYEKSIKPKEPSKIFSITREKYKTRYYFLGLKYVKFNSRQEILDLIKEENAKLRKEIEQLKNRIG